MRNICPAAWGLLRRFKGCTKYNEEIILKWVFIRGNVVSRNNTVFASVVQPKAFFHTDFPNLGKLHPQPTPPHKILALTMKWTNRRWRNFHVNIYTGCGRDKYRILKNYSALSIQHRETILVMLEQRCTAHLVTSCIMSIRDVTVTKNLSWPYVTMTNTSLQTHNLTLALFLSKTGQNSKEVRCSIIDSG